MTLAVGISSMRNFLSRFAKDNFTRSKKKKYFVQLTSEHQTKGKLRILSGGYSCHMSAALVINHCLARSDLGFDPRQGRKF